MSFSHRIVKQLGTTDNPESWLDGNFPSVKLIKAHYKEAGLFDWKNNRVNVLCRQIKCSPIELCAASGVFVPKFIEKYIDQNSWPVHLAIHFRKIEDQIHRLKFKEEPKIGPGPEDIEMAKLIARGIEPREK